MKIYRTFIYLISLIIIVSSLYIVGSIKAEAPPASAIVCDPQHGTAINGQRAQPCADCIIWNARGAGTTNLLDYYRRRYGMVNTDCGLNVYYPILYCKPGGDDPAACQALKDGVCKDVCAPGSPGACSLAVDYNQFQAPIPGIDTLCADCIAGQKPGDITYIKGAWGGNETCSNLQIVNHMCNGGVSAENKAGCLAVKNGACASSCQGSGSSGNSPIQATVELATKGVDPNNIPKGTPLTFNVTVSGNNVAGGLASTKLFWSRTDKNSSECTSSDKPTDQKGNVYCNMNATPTDLSSSATVGPQSGTFIGSFTPTIPGVYYIGPFITSHSSEANGSPRISCAGNPNCKWGSSASCLSDPSGNNCLSYAQCAGTSYNIGTCGNQSVYKITVSGAATTSTPVPSTSRTYQYRYSVDAPFNAGDASPAWQSFSPAGSSDTITIFNYALSNPVGGKVYTVFVQFKKSDQTTSEVSQRQITYVTPPPPTPPPVPTYTVEYRCADTSFDKDDTSSSSPQWKPYQNTDFSGAPIDFQYTFTHNVVPGADLTLFCQFRDNKGTKSPVVSKSIKYIGGQPRATSANCTFNPLGTGTLVTVRGLNFGPHDQQGTGNVRVEGKEANITSWVALGNEATSTASATPAPANSDTKYEIKTTISDKLTGGRHQIVITRDDGVVINAYCSLNLTTVDFTEKTTCLAQSGDLSAKDVSVDIKEKVEGAKSLISKKINIDKEGKPVDFTPGLEIGKTYVLSLRALKTVTRKVEFVAEEGTTNLNDIVLYVGDIYPVSSPDNKVNAFDKAEMSREWALNVDVTRVADLNNDARVNSVDYSCLQNNYNKSGD